MKLMSMLPFRRPYGQLLSVAIALVIGTSGGVSIAQTPSATPGGEAQLPEGPIGEQIGWVIDAANGEVSITNPLTVISHFSPDYIEAEGLDALIDLAYGLVRMYAPVTLESVEIAEDGASGNATLTARDGTLLDLFVEIDPGTGLITAVQVVPVAAGTPEANPIASPEAVVPPPSYAEIEADYTAKLKSLTDVGQATVAEFFAGDFEAIVDRFSPELQPQVPVESLESAQTSLTTDRVHFDFVEVGAVFDGHVSGDTIEGFFSQGFAGTFSLTAETTQTGTYPTGTWSGTINEIGLDFSVTFSGDATNLGATLTILSQNTVDAPQSNVSFEPVRPIGDLLDERALAISESSSAYRALHAWGPGGLVIDVVQAANGSLTGFAPTSQWPLPPNPTASILPIEGPFDGAWLTVWGGDNEFLNYHATSPQQRHAFDLVVWKDGTTHSGDGMEVEDYYAYGQTLYAPVSGKIVAVESSLPNMPPQIAQIADLALAEKAAEQAANQSPAGNHVVIQTEVGLFVYLAHMKPGSATVAVGDTVEVGDILGQVGNTGNTSEPHVHIHTQNSLDLFDPTAAGIPMVWNNVSISGKPATDAAPEQGDIVEPTRQ